MIDNVTITLLASSKSGGLASIIVKVSKLGLRYKKKLNDNLTDPSRLILYFEGTLNCSEEELMGVLNDNAHVESVEKIEFNNEGDHRNTSAKPIEKVAVETSEKLPVETKEKQSTPALKQSTALLNADDMVNAEALKIAEDYLVVDFGIIASLLVESAAKENDRVGDLFIALSNELEGNARSEFLDLVNNIDVPA